MWVRFTGDFDYRKPSFTVAYKADMTQNVTAECADMAVAAGKAVRLTKPNKDAEPVEADGEANDRLAGLDARLDRVFSKTSGQTTKEPHAVVMPPETKVEEHGSTDDAGRRTEQARNFPAENDSKG